jgi:hypothetical protein
MVLTPDGKPVVEPVSWYGGQFAKHDPVQLLTPDVSALYVYKAIPLGLAKYFPSVASVFVTKTALLTAGAVLLAEPVVLVIVLDDL